jgi:hypothetical protein
VATPLPALALCVLAPPVAVLPPADPLLLCCDVAPPAAPVALSVCGGDVCPPSLALEIVAQAHLLAGLMLFEGFGV